MTRFVVFTLASAVLIGCGQTPSPPDDAKTGTEKTGPADKLDPKIVKNGLPPFTPPTEVKLTATSPEDVKKFITSHKGQVVLVDNWAMYCAPCKKSMPHTIALSGKYAAYGLVVISVCIDSATAPGFSSASKFLKEKQATIVNFGSTVDLDNAFEAYGVGDLPIYDVYGVDGKRTRIVPRTGIDTDKAVEEAVHKALRNE